jgi:plastocyanin
MPLSANRPLALAAALALAAGAGGGVATAVGAKEPRAPAAGKRKAKANANANADANANANAKQQKHSTRRLRATKLVPGRGWVPSAALAAGTAGPGSASTAPSIAAQPAADPQPATPGPLTAAPTTTITTTTTTTTTTTGPAPLQAVGVTLDERSGYSAILSRATVTAGSVVVQLLNHGDDDHNLRVVPTDHAGAAVDFPLTGSRQTTTQTLTLTPGTYRLFCTLQTPVDHETAGMNATLRVTAGA